MAAAGMRVADIFVIPKQTQSELSSLLQLHANDTHNPPALSVERRTNVQALSLTWRGLLWSRHRVVITPSRAWTSHRVCRAVGQFTKKHEPMCHKGLNKDNKYATFFTKTAAWHQERLKTQIRKFAAEISASSDRKSWARSRTADVLLTRHRSCVQTICFVFFNWISSSSSTLPPFYIYKNIWLVRHKVYATVNLNDQIMFYVLFCFFTLFLY